LYDLNRLGLDKDVLAKLINTSSGQCWSSQTYNPCPGVVANVPSSNEYNGGFASELMTKDLLLALGILLLSFSQFHHQFLFVIRCSKRSSSIDSIN
jgi:hypothetical protein